MANLTQLDWEKIDNLLAAKAWDLTTLAEKSGVGRPTLSALRHAKRKRNASRRTIREIAEALGVPPVQILVAPQESVSCALDAAAAFITHAQRSRVAVGSTGAAATPPRLDDVSSGWLRVQQLPALLRGQLERTPKLRRTAIGLPVRRVITVFLQLPPADVTVRVQLVVFDRCAGIGCFSTHATASLPGAPVFSAAVLSLGGGPFEPISGDGTEYRLVIPRIPLANGPRTRSKPVHDEPAVMGVITTFGCGIATDATDGQDWLAVAGETFVHGDAAPDHLVAFAKGGHSLRVTDAWELAGFLGVGTRDLDAEIHRIDGFRRWRLASALELFHGLDRSPATWKALRDSGIDRLALDAAKAALGLVARPDADSYCRWFTDVRERQQRDFAYFLRGTRE